ncbi:unnamed protein product, partial [Larinioides sclopetarius]
MAFVVLYPKNHSFQVSRVIFQESVVSFFIFHFFMYCYIRYLCDGEKAIVHSSFVKDFTSEYDDTKTYEVFWSPNDEDTPMSVLAKQGKILTIDKEVEVNSQKRISAPLPGYYFAKIIMVADTEKELEDTLASKCGRKGKTKNEKEILQKKQKGKKVLEAVKLGKRKSTEMLLGSSGNIRSVFSDSDSDDSVIPIKLHKEEIAKYKKINKLLKIKNCDLKTENDKLKAGFDEVFNLNIELQKKLLNQLSPLLPSEKIVESPLLPLPTATAPPSIIAQSPQVNESIVDSFPEPAMDKMEKEQFMLDENHLNTVNFRVKPGQSGDSMFIKNLSSAVFGEEVLLSSSVTGSKCNAKKQSVAKPALCPKRLDYMK